MTYKWIKEPEMVLRIADGACIPNAPLNSDWGDFQKWVSEGNTPLAADQPHVPTQAEIIDAHFPQTGTARVLFEAFFEIANDIRGLKGLQPITRAQLKNWLQSKLP